MMQNLLTDSTSKEKALNTAEATPAAASNAPAAPAVVVVAAGGSCESQNPVESSRNTPSFSLRYGHQQYQQDQNEIHQQDQHCKNRQPPQTSSPLVLKGRVRYSFATRTLEGCQPQSLCSVRVHRDNVNSTATTYSSVSSCNGGSSASKTGTSNRATVASSPIGEDTATFVSSVADSASRRLSGVEVVSSDGSSSNGHSTVVDANNANGNKKSGQGSNESCNDDARAIPPSSPASASRSHDDDRAIPPSSPASASGSDSAVVSKKPMEGTHRCTSPSNVDVGSKTNSGKSSNNKNSMDDSCNISGDSEKKQNIPVLSASDIAVLLRDYAAFVQRTERQLQQLQKLVNCTVCLRHCSAATRLCCFCSTNRAATAAAAEACESATRNRRPDSRVIGYSSNRNVEDKSASVRQQRQWQRQQQRQQQPDELMLLRRFIAEGAVVCRSLHSRLCLLLADSPAAAAAAGSELLLGKLRRDFVQQQQQYSRLVRLLNSAADLLCEPPEPVPQHDAATTASSTSNTSSSSSGDKLPGSTAASGPARIIWHSRGHHGSPCSVPVDYLYFEDPQKTRQIDSILWGPEGGHLNTSSGRVGSSCLQHAGRSLWPQGSTEALPPLFIGASDERASAAGDAQQDSLWEPAALIEVHEDYEKQQIISERKQQLQQLQQVEHCVTVLRELQLHIAADVDRGSQRLQAVEEETEAAADLTAAGVGELAAASRSKTRWWGVQGGGAAALLGVSVGAVAGGPIGAAVGAVVGAVAGLSSGAALRGRHRERINAAERSGLLTRHQGPVRKQVLVTADPFGGALGGLLTVAAARHRAALHSRLRGDTQGRHQMQLSPAEVP
ncbi:hypothetical protein, conserved [Eimeria praecox]|uniref:t-SNARE coiled-coil homology domain-containing protein n=1 Tax=Eimeria praecox TaxID=51316 RepID=U6GWN1_9EIME|nr:hypothetical protein, conserved [Eimeria praecox]